MTGIENVSNYNRGIEGVVLDIARLKVSSLPASDFIFRVAPSGTRGNVIANLKSWPSTPCLAATREWSKTSWGRVRELNS